MKIHAYCMAFDEAEWIAGYVKSALKYCDSCTVFDNGSADGTPDLAKAAGAEIIMVDPPQPRDCRDYNDKRFGHGWRRNWCIDRIRGKGDWVFNMDADEEMIAKDPDVLRGLISANPGARAFLIMRWDLWGDRDLYRTDWVKPYPWLWQNGIGIRYGTGSPPHEGLVFANGESIRSGAVRVPDAEARILHHHYTRGWKANMHVWGSEANRIRAVEDMRRGSDPKVRRVPWL